MILGFRIPVEITTMRNSLGEFTTGGNAGGRGARIKISLGQTPEAASETLFHECVHAALFFSGISNVLGSEDDHGTEEAVVRCIEHAFSGAIDIKKLGGKSE